ncbi:hypothetical protein V6N13_047878 [Hibiscus sabdariffa]
MERIFQPQKDHHGRKYLTLNGVIFNSESTDEESILFRSRGLQQLCQPGRIGAAMPQPGDTTRTQPVTWLPAPWVRLVPAEPPVAAYGSANRRLPATDWVKRSKGSPPAKLG